VVTSEQRRYAKVINFGLIYGMSAFGLAGNLGIERSARKIYRPLLPALSGRGAVHGGYPYQSQGTWLCRNRVRPPSVAAGNQQREWSRRQGAERAAINAPMQGTAADLIKLAMIAVQNWLESASVTDPHDHAGTR
jgi:DNA polymerase-1